MSLMESVIQHQKPTILHLVWMILISWIFILVQSTLKFTINHQIQNFILIAGILLGGVPHGAIDHIIQKEKNKLEGRTYQVFKFYAQYLLVMGIYGALWYLFPVLSLLIFLLITSWHFGETDLFEIKFKSDFFRSFYYVLYGLWLIAYLLVSHQKEVNLILETMNVPWLDRFLISILKIQETLLFYMVFVGIAIAAILMILKKNFSTTLFLSITFIFLLAWIPLYLAFTLYFTAWHSLRSLGQIGIYLKTKNTMLEILKLTLPNTLLAILFLIGLYYFWIQKYPSGSFVLLIFILLSLLTMPHFLIMHTVFTTSQKKG